MTTPPTTEPGAAQLVSTTQMARTVAHVRPSLVALRIDRSSGVSTATGIIAEAGGIIATTAAAIAGARSIWMDSPNGTWAPAEFVGSDPISGIGVVRVTSDLPVANFADSDPAPGSPAMAMALRPNIGRPSAPRTSVFAGSVRSSGTAFGTGGAATGFAVTTTKMPLSSQDSGCALLNSQGQVSGILERTQVQGAATIGIFLPAELVLGVTRQLVAVGSVKRGWLGIDGSNLDRMISTTPSPIGKAQSFADGVALDAIKANSAAARAGLQVGDVIMAVNGEAVHSMAELRTQLYPDLPGTTVTVTIDRSGTLEYADVVLAPAE
ncbi:MAG: S1C family serine protease [Acidimicrobiales bacterium]